MLKRFVLAFVFVLLILPMSASAVSVSDSEEATTYNTTEFQDQLYASGAGGLPNDLPDGTRQLLRKLGIDRIDPDVLLGLSPATLANAATGILGGSVASPLKAAAAIIGIILLCALMDGFKLSFGERELGSVFGVVASLSIATVVLVPALGVIQRAGGAVSSGSAFMISFVPVLSGIMTAGGQPVTANTYQVLMLGAAEVISFFASYLLVPLMGIFLAFSLVSTVTPDLKLDSTAALIHKSANWTLGLAMTLFVGLLTVQGVIGNSADTVTMKTAKFVSGSFIPVVGSAIGDAFGTVQGCVKLLKTSVGGFGIIAVALMFLPSILETLAWLLVLSLCASFGEMFQLESVTAILRAASKVMSLLLSVMICSSVLIIVSTTIVMMMGGVV